MFKKRTLIEIVSLLILISVGCNKNPVDITPNPTVNIEEVSVIDSTFSLKAMYAPEAYKPDLLLKAKITFRADPNYADILSSAVTIENVTKQFSSNMDISNSDSTITIEMEDVFKDIVPFISKPLVTTNIQISYKTDNIDSIFTFVLKSKYKVSWTGLSEPEIKMIGCYTHVQSPRGPIIWHPDSKGFYYHGSFGIYNQLLYYSLLDYSIKALTSSTSSFKVCDVSHDGELLLVADDIADPENIYLFDISTKALLLLIPARENFGISSARFSSDDNIIAFTIVDKSLPSTKDPIWLYERNDSSLINIVSVASNSFPEITSWYPESNDRFVFHNDSPSIYNYSIKNTTLSKVYFGFPFYPRQLVLDGSKILGRQINEIVAPDVTESHVWIYDTDTNPISQLTFYPEVIFHYSLSPDGTQLAFTAYRDNEFGLWLLSVDNIISNLD